jgi:peptidoglycan/LPS O-acetylase OafA/YrhL
MTLLPAAYYAVDTFFFVGGFLAAVLLLEKLTKLMTIKFSLVPAMWLHRFLRIWPTYAFCIIIFW